MSRVQHRLGKIKKLTKNNTENGVFKSTLKEGPIVLKTLLKIPGIEGANWPWSIE